MGGTRMNDEKEGELAKETFLKLGWDIYDERDVEVLSEAFKSHGKAMFEKGMNTCAEMSTHLGLLPINSVGMRKGEIKWQTEKIVSVRLMGNVSADAGLIGLRRRFMI